MAPPLPGVQITRHQCSPAVKWGEQKPMPHQSDIWLTHTGPSEVLRTVPCSDQASESASCCWADHH